MPRRLPFALAGLLAALLSCNLPGSQNPPPTAIALPTSPPAQGTAPDSPPTATPPTPAPTPEPTQPLAPTPDHVLSLPDPSGLRLTLVVDGLDRPLGLEHAGDQRLFVVEQRGLVWVVQDGQLRATPYLDLRDRVTPLSEGEYSEQGLLGLAFHPQFARTGQVYVNYTDAGGDTIVSRLIASAGAEQIDPGTEQVLLRIDQPFSNHNGGDLEFGPDGYLYIATGDGGAAADPFGNGQRLDALLGKLLRIDVDGGDPYAIPGGNPFASGGGLPEIWAYGLRNPWRIDFDPLTGELYIGDVGQNAWEEIDFLPAGFSGPRNFGWNLREGTHTFAGPASPDMIDPVAEYANGAGGTCSVTGGVVIRSPSLPDWNGAYLFGDYCSGQVWGLVRDASGTWTNRQLFNTDLTLSAFGRDAQGEVYLVHHGGAVFRLERSQ